MKGVFDRVVTQKLSLIARNPSFYLLSFGKELVILRLIFLGMAIALIRVKSKQVNQACYMAHLKKETESWQNHCLFAKRF